MELTYKPRIWEERPAASSIAENIEGDETKWESLRLCRERILVDGDADNRVSAKMGIEKEKASYGKWKVTNGQFLTVKSTLLSEEE